MKPTTAITLTHFTISAKFTLHERGAPEPLLYSYLEQNHIACCTYYMRCETMQMHSIDEFSIFLFLFLCYTLYAQTRSYKFKQRVLCLLLFCSLTLRKTPAAYLPVCVCTVSSAPRSDYDHHHLLHLQFHLCLH